MYWSNPTQICAPRSSLLLRATFVRNCWPPTKSWNRFCVIPGSVKPKRLQRLPNAQIPGRQTRTRAQTAESHDVRSDVRHRRTMSAPGRCAIAKRHKRHAFPIVARPPKSRRSSCALCRNPSCFRDTAAVCSHRPRAPSGRPRQTGNTS